jgi:hypothetical protein
MIARFRTIVLGAEGAGVGVGVGFMLLLLGARGVTIGLELVVTETDGDVDALFDWFELTQAARSRLRLSKASANLEIVGLVMRGESPFLQIVRFG